MKLSDMTLSELREKEKQLKNSIAAKDNEQMAMKILLNGGYGALGNQYFRYYDLRTAEAITLSGRLSIRWIGREVNEYINKIMKTSDFRYVVYTDTDSIYITLDKLVERYFPNKSDIEVTELLDKFCDSKLKEFIDKSYAELAENMNAYEQKMEMSREKICSSVIWTAKKRYCMNVMDDEGVRYEKPKLKVIGLESKRSTTPKYIRNYLEQIYGLCLGKTESEVIKSYNTIKDEFMNMDIESISYTSGISDIGKWVDHGSGLYKKGTPKHVKAAIIHNWFKNKLGLHLKDITESDKIKYVDLKMPNPTGQEVIGFVDYMPKEFKLENYINKKRMFDSIVVKPMKTVLIPIQWSYEKKESLLDIF